MTEPRIRYAVELDPASPDGVRLVIGCDDLTTHHPHIDYLCDDPDCHPNGAPRATCHHDGRTWPCDAWIASHKPGEVVRAKRWTNRTEEYPTWDI